MDGGHTPPKDVPGKGEQCGVSCVLGLGLTGCCVCQQALETLSCHLGWDGIMAAFGSVSVREKDCAKNPAGEE